jgi:hypothetical protein
LCPRPCQCVRMPRQTRTQIGAAGGPRPWPGSTPSWPPFRGAVGIDSDNLDDRDPAKVSSATKQTNEPKSKHTNKQTSKQAGEGHFTAPCEVTLAE